MNIRKGIILLPLGIVGTFVACDGESQLKETQNKNNEVAEIETATQEVDSANAELDKDVSDLEKSLDELNSEN
ncbi:hypothetical protein LX73_1417 [Fodinibius salinus]|uniref:Uncharacterized protein n=1 Tax=Fodinibius salinus TaxID=860790 RepID=A0A5D3YLY0_9BACT|nr:hypothetical protein [Fodinibius salinus]TYP93707.1 hypothetical protein LX73_1417 [Fodinibius salinus]